MATQKEFSLTWDEVLRLYSSFVVQSQGGFSVKKEMAIVELLKRSDIGPITKQDITDFYNHLRLPVGEEINFAK